MTEVVTVSDKTLETIFSPILFIVFMHFIVLVKESV